MIVVPAMATPNSFDPFGHLRQSSADRRRGPVKAWWPPKWRSYGFALVGVWIGLNGFGWYIAGRAAMATIGDPQFTALLGHVKATYLYGGPAIGAAGLCIMAFGSRYPAGELTRDWPNSWPGGNAPEWSKSELFRAVWWTLWSALATILTAINASHALEVAGAAA